MAEPTAPKRIRRRLVRSPKKWGGFVHLWARFYMDYYAALKKAIKRRFHRAVDIDTNPSAERTAWALHWATIGKNKLHDPRHELPPDTRIDSLEDEQIIRLRGPKGQHPRHLLPLLRLAAKNGVRVEVELKARMAAITVRRLLADPDVAAMNKRGDLQFKMLAFMPHVLDCLKIVKDEGGTTILSFTKYPRKRPGLSKSQAWPVVDYVRGRPRWVD